MIDCENVTIVKVVTVNLKSYQLFCVYKCFKMEEARTTKAIIMLLNELFKPNIKINECQVASLVKCVTGIPNNVVSTETLNTVLTVWLIEAVSKWENDVPTDAALLSLGLNFSVYLCSKEETFLKLNNHNVFHRFIELIKRALEKMNATPNIGYVRFMSAFLNHQSGSQWIMSTNYWSEIIVLTLASQPNSDFSLAGYQFISKLIAKTISMDLAFCKKVLEVIASPIVNFDSTSHDDHLHDQSLLQDIEANLYLVAAVLELLMGQRKLSIYETILEIVKLHNFETRLEDLKQKILNNHTTFHIIVILLALSFYSLAVEKSKVPSSYITQDCLLKMGGKGLAIFNDLLTNCPIDLFLKCCTKTQEFCEKLGPLAPKIITTEKLITSLGEQVLFLQLVPCCFISNKLLGIDMCEEPDDEIRIYSVQKTHKRTLPQTFRFILLAKKNLEMTFTLDNVTLSLKYILDTRQEFANEQQKIIVLQILMFCFEDLSIAMKSVPEHFRTLPGKENFVLQLLKTLTTIIKEFDVNWKDILETMMLMHITHTVLRFEEWEKDIYVSGLELISIAFSKHLSINMALLMDKPKEDDFLEDTITFVHEKLQDTRWEIRSAATDVIMVISQNSKRFLWLAKMLINKDIPYLVLRMALADKEITVRISSFKCLQEMVKINEIWNYLQSSNDIVNSLPELVYQESDIPVLTEIVTLVTNIYEHQNTSIVDAFLFYDIMSYPVHTNLNKEVKIRTLQFWKKVIDNCLASQGMIDGEFPKVTFSKNKRKIVLLNDEEIKRRLHKILEELNENGCLVVLSSALEDENDVQKAAMNVMEIIIRQFKKYNIITDSFDLFKESEEEFLTLTNLHEIDNSRKMFGPKTVPPQHFLNTLNRQLLFFNSNKTISVCEELEKLLEEILNYNVFLLNL